MKILASVIITVLLFSCGGISNKSAKVEKTEDQIVEEVISEIETDQLELKENTEKSISEIDSLLNSI